MIHEHVFRLYPALIVLLVQACTPDRTRPVDLFPEDNCASCRMAISDPSFASEILTPDGDALKFDDLGCLAAYRKNHPALIPRVVFVKEFESKEWLAYDSSIIVATSIQTPMGSGQVAVRDAGRARIIAERYPPAQTAREGSCCDGGSE